MALGEVRRLDIPSEEGYGARGFPAWGIGPGDGLLFEIEVLKIDGK
jgi:FKBP-type peptidyl-prolyl cis-trans isomerase